MEFKICRITAREIFSETKRRAAIPFFTVEEMIEVARERRELPVRLRGFSHSKKRRRTAALQNAGATHHRSRFQEPQPCANPRFFKTRTVEFDLFNV